MLGLLLKAYDATVSVDLRDPKAAGLRGRAEPREPAAGRERPMHLLEQMHPRAPGKVLDQLDGAHAGDRVVGRDALLELTLDNGEAIHCTPDHGFILRDGREAQAADLRPGDLVADFFCGSGTTLAVAEEPKLKDLLGIPPHVAICAVMPLGRPVKPLSRLKRWRIVRIVRASQGRVRGEKDVPVPGLESEEAPK